MQATTETGETSSDGTVPAAADSAVMPASYSRKVGERLRAIRRQKRLSLQEVEAASGEEFKASVLGAYERGERAISVPRLQRLARFYAVPVDRLLGDVSGSGPEPSTSMVGDIDLVTAEQSPPPLSSGCDERVTFDLRSLESMNRPGWELLGRYIRMIQARRSSFEGDSITIRSEDVRVLTCLLDVPAEGLA